MLSLQQLLTPVSEDDALSTELTILSQLGFQATSWQTGSIQLITLRLFARLYSGLTTAIANIAAGGFTTVATSNWLTLVAFYIYDLTRLPAQSTLGNILLTSSAAAPTVTFNAGDIIVSNSPFGTSGALTYTCTQGGTLTPGSALSVTFSADVAGAASNIAPGTTLYLWTPFVGVTPTNPALLPSNTWITTAGQNPESDARLSARCIGRWSRLTYGNTDGAYIGWALEALPTLTRVSVLAAQGNCSVTIVGATPTGPISAGDIITIQNYVNGVLDGIGRRPINDIFTAQGSTTVTTPAITVTAYVVSSIADTAASLIAQNILTYIGNIPIGGNKLQSTQGYALFYPMSQAASVGIVGIKDLVFSATADVPLAAGQIYAPTVTVNVQIVAPGT